MKFALWRVLGIVIALTTNIVGAGAEDRPTAPAPIVPIFGILGMSDHVEGRIAFLKTELKITDAQLPQWNAFADAIRSNARKSTDIFGAAGQAAALNAPDRLDRREKVLTAMLDMLRATKATLAPLYSVLGNDQKKLADTLLREPIIAGM
jgi:hypothetical protein